MSRLQVDYVFGNVTTSTKKMLAVFSEAWGSEFHLKAMERWMNRKR